MMSKRNVAELMSIVARMVGTSCWGVVAGGCTGSRFALDFGNKIEWPVKISNSMLTADERKYRGEFGLQVGCAAWRLDSKQEVITAWTDLASPDGPMVKGLERLRGRVVTRTEVSQPGLDLLMEFDKEYFLRVFCDQMDEDLDNYTISFRNVYVEVEARSRIDIEDSGNGVEGRDRGGWHGHPEG
jgi:hypothetical protein